MLERGETGCVGTWTAGWCQTGKLPGGRIMETGTDRTGGRFPWSSTCRGKDLRESFMPGSSRRLHTGKVAVPSIWKSGGGGEGTPHYRGLVAKTPPKPEPVVF